MKKLFFASLILIFSFVRIFAEVSYDSIGADAAFPYIEKVLQSVPIPSDKIYICTDEDVEKLIAKTAEVKINIFELLDCTYRYLSKNELRVVIKGSSLKKLTEKFIYGDERILSLIPIPIIEKIETGFSFKPGQKPLQIFLSQKYEKYIEIGTAFYEKEFGFEKMEPHLFLDSYGMKVKKFNIKLKIKKIHLYESAKGAIYAKGFYKPKKWYLCIVEKKENQTENMNE